MHVVHTINGLRADHGGPSRSVGGLAEATAAQEVDVEIVAGRDATDAVVRPEAVPVHFAARPGVRDLLRPTASAYGRTLAGAIGPQSLVHDHGLWLPSNRIAAAVAARRGVPRVVSVRGMVSAAALAQGAAKKRLAWRLYQRRDLERATLLHATSHAETDALRRLGLTAPIATVANGVDLPALAPRDDLEAVRTALFLSRLHPIKGLLDLVAAWARVRPEGWRLVIAGPDEGGHRAEAEQAVRDADLSDVVRFIGPVDDDAKWSLYRHADLFVLPTHSENFGIVIGEALAAEVPVLTTKGAPWHELGTHGCGWWTDIGPEAIAATLAEATALPTDRLRAMGLRGRQLVEARYSWARAAVQMAAAYAWAMGHGPRPDFVTNVGA